MSRAKRFEPLVELAKQRSRKGLEAVAYLRSKIAEEQQRLQDLEQCQIDYENNKSNGKQSFSAQSLKSYQEFQQNLRLATEQQRRHIQSVESQLATVQESWRQLDAKAKGLEKTRARLLSQEELEASKREQKQLDEMNSVRQARNAGLQR